MDRRIGRLADAQTASSPPSNTQFDGTYAFVSVMHVNETYPISGTNRIGQCPNSAAERLTIVNGQAQYSDSGGQAQYSASGSRQFEGTVGSHGELVMRMPPQLGHYGNSPGAEMILVDRIDGNGTVSARRKGYYCSYDLIWQRSK